MVFLFLALFPRVVFAQEDAIPEQIPAALRTGNAAMLAGYFNPHVELVILDKEDVYSKEQAMRIIQDFFASHQPRQFTIKHQGGKSQSRYAIGQLQTKTGNYRVYFLLKWTEGKAFIHQLRIESENE